MNAACLCCKTNIGDYEEWYYEKISGHIGSDAYAGRMFI